MRLGYIIFFATILLFSCTKEIIQHKLSVSVSPINGGSVTPPSNSYEKGQSLQMLATPAGEYLFKEWEGDLRGSANPSTLIIDKDKVIIGTFEKRQYPLNLTIEGSGTIKEEITAVATQSQYPSGTTVRLTPQPLDGWAFKSWSGYINSNANILELLINKPVNLIATFEKIKIKEVVISFNSKTVKPWTNIQFAAKALDEKGNIVSGNIVKWTSDNTNIATVSSSGMVTSNLIGKVNIYASINDVIGTFALEVNIENSIEVGENIILDPNGSGSETSITLNPINPLNIVASANWFHYSTFDGGRNWKKLDVGKDGMAMADPNVTFLPNGTLLRQGLTWESGSPRGIAIQKSIDGGKTLESTIYDWAYKPLKDQGNADQGIVNSDNYTGSKFKGFSYILFSDYPVKPAYPQTGFSLIFQRSENNGINWSSPMDISTCLNCGQESSSYITSGPNGEVYAAWWNFDRVVFNRSFDAGKTWEKEITVRTRINRSNKYLLTDDVRGNITIDVDKSIGPNHGTIYISGTDQNGQLGGAADSWVVSSKDFGNSWSAPILISDGPKGAYKYYFQPRISVAPNGRIDAIWYDTRNWTGTDINKVDYDIYYSYSLDGAKSFSKNYRVTKSSKTKITTCPTQEPCAQRRLYEYIGLTSDTNRALAIWTSMENNIDKPAFSTIWIK